MNLAFYGLYMPVPVLIQTLIQLLLFFSIIHTLSCVCLAPSLLSLNKNKQTFRLPTNYG
jgi:hypothetical protein